MVAKHGLVSSEYYFPSTMTEAQITGMGDVGGKPREEGKRTLISNLYLCLGHEGQRALHNQHPHLNMEEIRYPRFLDTCVALFQKQRNETYEMYQMLPRKQKERESLESFYAELSGMAARCNLGTQERKMERDTFTFNMRNRDAQNELYRETKTPEQALQISTNTQRLTRRRQIRKHYGGDKYAKTYKESAPGSTETAYTTPGGSLQIKAEPISNIRGSRGRGIQGDGDNTRIGEEAKRKNVDITTVTSRISLQNTDNDAQQEPSHAISAKRSGILRRLVGENGCHVGDNQLD